jgi:DNA-binding transcriptional MerR regulator/methylmalonyl-CoA mutase cobalamin-binding subunit
MDIEFPPLPVHSSISDVERDTGLAKETLRVWERRYAFPQPLRDDFGVRLYPAEQVSKLRLVKRLLDLGYRPGKIIQRSADELRVLAEGSGTPVAAVDRTGQDAGQAELLTCLDLCKSHQMDVLRSTLLAAAKTMGLKKFVIELVAPLVAMVGDAWAAGQIAIFEEHLFTESLHMVLRHVIFSMPQQRGPSTATPRILLTTFPQERHALGLLMAEAIFVAQGAFCISLGVQTPLLDIVEAARVKRADIVALSFSDAMNPRQAFGGLTELRARLPKAVELWAGGNNPALRKRPPGFVRVLGLEDAVAAVEHWRERHRGAAAGVH